MPPRAAWLRARIRCLGVRGQGAVPRSASDHQGTRAQGTESRPSSPRATSGAYLGRGPRRMQDVLGDTGDDTPPSPLSPPEAQNTPPSRTWRAAVQSREGGTPLPTQGTGTHRLRERLEHFRDTHGQCPAWRGRGASGPASPGLAVGGGPDFQAFKGQGSSPLAPP